MHAMIISQCHGMTQGALDAGHKICMLESSATALQGAFKIPDDQVILMDAQES
jgi:hypothetical protein